MCRKLFMVKEIYRQKLLYLDYDRNVMEKGIVA